MPRGAPLGIPGAPDPLPAPDRLVGTPWTLCSARFADGPPQSILYLSRAPAGGTEPPDGTGLLIGTPDGSAYLVWRHTRYRVPRASLVILLGTVASFNLPVEPIFIILGIDELMDMARTSTNVIGNCLATVVIARWEGEFGRTPASPVVAEALAD